MKKQKWISLLCAVVLLSSLFSFSALAAVPGDVNADGLIQAEDARLCLRQAVGLEHYARSSAAFLACDVTDDNEITAEDARLILRAAVGLETLAKPEYHFQIPMQLYDSDNVTITLTNIFTDTEYNGYKRMNFVFTLKNKTESHYVFGYDSVTINGFCLPVSNYSYELAPWGTTTVLVEAFEYQADFGNSVTGEMILDSYQMLFLFSKENDEQIYLAEISFYPTNDPSYSRINLPADLHFETSYKEDRFLFGYQGAQYHFADYTVNGAYPVKYLYAEFFFANTSDHPLVIFISDVRINDSYKVNVETEKYLFPHSAASPLLFIDENDIFGQYYFYSIERLDYTVKIGDFNTGEIIYEDNYYITWNNY